MMSGKSQPTASADPAAAPADLQRIDKWLWHARIVRARTAAAELVSAGHVRINGQRVTAPGHSVRAGDVLTIALDREVRVLRVRGFAAKRGNAQEALALYQSFDP